LQASTSHLRYADAVDKVRRADAAGFD